MTLFDIVNENKQNEFYPTPAGLAERILFGIDWSTIETVLEPSAGKGDLLRALAKKENKYFDVDCIEIDANLRAILKHNFSSDRERDISREIRELSDKSYIRGEGYDISHLPKKEQERYTYLEEEKETFFHNGIHIVGDDFLKYETDKHYDLILMNPPFSEGDKHLLNALEMQKNGGNIICLLNAETIRNPYTNTRKLLVQKLNEYGANIEYVENSFSAAERQTDVEVAIIKVAIPAKVFDSEFLHRFIEAEKYEEIQLDNTELALTDYIKAAIAQYKVECKAGIALIKEYEALKPYILNSLEKSDGSFDYRRPIIELKVNGKDNDSKVNEYLKSVRYKYWYALLHNKKYI
ncbi:MAG: class I SAM-dependent methyltransferase, partial [Ruminococcus sp.]|nr:class I SAM-dependent methyltransferase [Ruminococcus sp.]